MPPANQDDAVLAIASSGGSGRLNGGSGFYQLDFGEIHANANNVADLLVENAAADPAFPMSGVLAASGDPYFFNSGLGGYGPLLAGQTSGFSVALSATTGGIFSEVVTVSATETASGVEQSLSGATLSVSGTVYLLAQPTLTPPQIFNVRQGDGGGSVVLPIAIANIAPATGYSENLLANVVSFGAGVTDASGSVNLLAGASSNSALTASLGDTQTGVSSGTVAIALTSDGTGIDALGTTSLGTATVGVSLKVFGEAHAQLSAATVYAHVGDGGGVAVAPITVANTAPATGYYENLIATVVGSSFPIISASGSTGDVSAGASNNSALSATLSATQAGVYSGTVQVALVSDGTGIDGLGTIALPVQDVQVSVVVDNYAVAQILGANPLAFGDFHVGSSQVETLDVVNAATGPSDALAGSLSASGDTGAFVNTGLGAIAPLAAGAQSAFAVAFAPTTTGVFSETIKLAANDVNAASGFNQSLGGQTVSAQGDAFGYAQASLTAPTIYVHTGDNGGVAVAPIVVANTAPANGYYENLIATALGSTSPLISASGATNDVSAGASDSSALMATVSDAQAGVYSGSVHVGLVSDGSGVDSLGTTALATQDVAVTVDVDNYAVAAIQSSSGPGVLSQNGDVYTLDLGKVALGSGPLVEALEVVNAATGQADQLSGALGGGGGPFVNSGLGAFGALSAGQASSFSVSLSAADVGVFSETITLAATGANPSGFSAALPGETLVVTGDIIPCFAKGARILTARGEVAVEALAIGDRVVTASGALRPIVWLGRRALDLRGHPAPQLVQPVRICAHALGEGLPRRDLWLSPGHSIASEGALIPASALVNGRSVAQVEVAEVEYWHVELDAHDVIFAEGLPAESYLDTGNRTAFANGGAFVEAHPDFAPRHWADTCKPLALEGPAVAATKARLLARLAEMGCSVSPEADARVMVDGIRIEPIWLSDTKLAFVMEPGGREITLRSRTFVPAQTKASSADTRALGLCVGAMLIDGAPIALADDEACAFGWHEAECRDETFTHRWTTGVTPLPAGARIVIVDLAGAGCYWRETQDADLALTA